MNDERFIWLIYIYNMVYRIKPNWKLWTKLLPVVLSLKVEHDIETYIKEFKKHIDPQIAHCLLFQTKVSVRKVAYTLLFILPGKSGWTEKNHFDKVYTYNNEIWTNSEQM